MYPERGGAVDRAGLRHRGDRLYRPNVRLYGGDKDWEDITTWSCTLDTRYMPYADRQLETIGSRFLEISGTNFPAMAPKFQWFQAEFPDEAKKIAKYLMISVYVIGKLGALPIEDAVMDCSFTSWTGLADVKNRCWSEEICGEIGLDRKYLPQTLEELDEWADAMTVTDGSGNVTRYGFIPWLDSGEDPFTFPYICGATLFDAEAQEFVLTDDTTVEFYTWMQDYAKRYDPEKIDSFTSSAGGQFTPDHPMMTGSLAMTVCGNWFTNSMTVCAGCGIHHLPGPGH